jgi:Protein of unknown function (DUF3105)
MATKKRRRNRPSARPAAASSTAAAGSPNPTGQGSSGRREKKELARAAREAERKREARAATIRRAAVFSVAGLAAFGTLWWLQRAASPRPIAQAAVRAASAAGCTIPKRPLADAPGGQHLQSGEAHTYDQRPATSGPHDPTPLPDSPNVYTQPVPETQAVHTMEHAGILVYYRSDGDGALPADVVGSLAQVVESAKNTVLAPYDGLPDGVSLALATWNELQTCPGSITAGQADTVTQGFIDAFVCTGIAPEPKASGEC